MSDLRTELLEIHLKRNALTDHMVAGANLIVEGGIEGIQEVAQTHPEVIISALVGLTRVIEHMQIESNQALERELALFDKIPHDNPS